MMANLQQKCAESDDMDSDDVDSLDEIEDETEAFACDFCMDSGKLWDMKAKMMAKCTACKRR